MSPMPAEQLSIVDTTLAINETSRGESILFCEELADAGVPTIQLRTPEKNVHPLHEVIAKLSLAARRQVQWSMAIPGHELHRDSEVWKGAQTDLQIDGIPLIELDISHAAPGPSFDDYVDQNAQIAYTRLQYVIERLRSLTHQTEVDVRFLPHLAANAKTVQKCIGHLFCHKDIQPHKVIIQDGVYGIEETESIIKSALEAMREKGMSPANSGLGYDYQHNDPNFLSHAAAAVRGGATHLAYSHQIHTPGFQMRPSEFFRCLSEQTGATFSLDTAKMDIAYSHLLHKTW